MIATFIRRHMLILLAVLGFFYSEIEPRGLIRQLPRFNKHNRVLVDDLVHNVHQVDQGNFYRSRQLSAEKLAATIKRFGIKTLINLRGEHPTEKWWQAERATAQALGVQYINLPVRASQIPSESVIKQLLHAYDTAPRPLLVHCQGGADRTGMASALWALEKQGLSKKEARKQLSLWYGHDAKRFKAMDDFIISWSGPLCTTTPYHLS